MAQVDNVQRDGLKRYYFLRAGVSVAWILAAVAVGTHSPLAAIKQLADMQGWDAAKKVDTTLRVVDDDSEQW